MDAVLLREVFREDVLVDEGRDEAQHAGHQAEEADQELFPSLDHQIYFNPIVYVTYKYVDPQPVVDATKSHIILLKYSPLIIIAFMP